MSDTQIVVAKIDAEVAHESEKAFGFDIDGSKVWLPKSQLDSDEVRKYAPGDHVQDLIMPDWLAKDKGFEYR